VKTLYLITGSCPQTYAEAWIEMAEICDANGEPMRAAGWRQVLAKWQKEWADPERARIKANLTGRGIGHSPDDLVPQFGTPEYPIFWHNPTRDDTIVCPCGHFSAFLCDEPIGRGRTCDLPTCKCCRNQTGSDMDQCAFHARRLAIARMSRSPWSDGWEDPAMAVYDDL
jgi:hypothetical protein